MLYRRLVLEGKIGGIEQCRKCSWHFGSCSTGHRPIQRRMTGNEKCIGHRALLGQSKIRLVKLPAAKETFRSGEITTVPWQSNYWGFKS